MNSYRERLERALQAFLKDKGHLAPHLHEAMNYVVLNGGKRWRALLVYVTGETYGATPDMLDAPACAVELIHAYSLVHDDLPAMDNSDLRRGKPSCHIAFDEATAVLVGDALQALAFDLLADAPYLPEAVRLKMIQQLTRAIGSEGMVAGQMLDLAAEGQKSLSEADLEAIHRLKTGALISTSVLLGAAAAPLKAPELVLKEYADALGVSFQIQDDILDVTASTAEMGKPSQLDQAQDKATYPSILGLNLAKASCHANTEKALLALDSLGPASGKLAALTNEILSPSQLL